MAELSNAKQIAETFVEVASVLNDEEVINKLDEHINAAIAPLVSATARAVIASDSPVLSGTTEITTIEHGQELIRGVVDEYAAAAEKFPQALSMAMEGFPDQALRPELAKAIVEAAAKQNGIKLEAQQQGRGRF